MMPLVENGVKDVYPSKFAIMRTVRPFIYPGHPILDPASPFGARESVTRVCTARFTKSCLLSVDRGKGAAG